MALTRSIAALITDGSGSATSEFLVSTPEHWAATQMSLRYGHMLLLSDGPTHIASLCYQYLLDEHKALKGWFQSDNKFSALLSSRFLTTYFNKPLGDGIGWDFKASGEPESLMVSFKSQLLSAQRAVESIPLEVRTSDNMILGGIRTMVRSAYTSRAKMHSWRPRSQIEKKEYSGTEMSVRWVAIQSFVFLIRAGINPSWAWESSKCKGLLGPFDEERVISELGV